MERLVVTAELRSKALQFGACYVPEVGTAIEDIPVWDLVWAECLGECLLLPLWVYSQGESVYEFEYGGGGGGTTVGDSYNFRAGDGDGFEIGDYRGGGDGDSMYCGCCYEENHNDNLSVGDGDGGGRSDSSLFDLFRHTPRQVLRDPSRRARAEISNTVLCRGTFLKLLESEKWENLKPSISQRLPAHFAARR